VRRVYHSAIPATIQKSSGFENTRAKVVCMLEGLKVVVAEDEGLIRMDVVSSLEEAGLVVVGQASDGEEAIALATEHEPDLVVMDVKMPRLDGISAAEKIAELKIPVVLLTAFSDAELVSRAAEAGAMAYVTKPFKPSDLLPAIQIALSRHEELVSLENEIADLSDRLETRKLMDRAKGLLQTKMKLSEPDAFRWIQKASMDRRLTMAQVAKAVIDQLSDK
jgi:two-component system, response regulator PdtaR